jgi:hypothetical protein
MQPGRNALCPCGSGKKYKKCCALNEAGQAADTPNECRETQENQEEALDPEFGEFLLQAVRNLRKAVLERQSHIKAYYRIRKMHEEIVEAMIRYHDDGKFEQQIDSTYRFPDMGDREIHLLNATFDPETRVGAHCLYDMLIYKPALNMSCITEDFIRLHRYRKPEKVAFLHSMLDSKLGLYEITDVDRDHGYAYLREVFTGEERRIIDVGLSGDLNYSNFFLYTRIIEVQGICFGTGLNLVFTKDDRFIREHIQKHKKGYSSQGEFVRFIELHNRYSQYPDSVQVVPNRLV